MDYTVYGILQARILEWAAFPFTRVTSLPKDQAQISHIAEGFFTSRDTNEAHTYIYIPSLLKLPPTSLPPLEVDTGPLFEFPETDSKFPLARYLKCGHVSLQVTTCIHLTVSSSLPMSISLFSMTVSPPMPCR